MSVTVLPELIPLDTPQGRGYAFLVETGEHDNRYTVILENRAIVTFTQDRVLACRNYSQRRGITDAEMREAIANFTAAMKRPAPTRQRLKVVK